MANKQLLGNRLFIKTKKGNISLPLDYQDDKQIANKPVIPHKAVEQYTQTEPFDPEISNLPADWLKFIHTDDWNKYALWFRSKQVSTDYIPIRVLTQLDLLNDRFDNYVKFTANENSSIEVIRTGTISVDLQYSFDGIQWEVYTSYTRTLNLEKGQTVLFKGNNPTGLNTDESNYITFNLIGDVAVSGNVMGLIDKGAGTTTEIPNTYCFYKLFISSIGITSISKKFLPATTLKAQCYYQMFNGCSNLRNAPTLPAMELTNDCYRAMFYGCTSLKEAPELPSTTLAINCYRSMFYQCTSLRIAPYLPSTNLLTGCYYQMFSNCNSLFSVKIAYTGNFADTTNAFTTWLDGVPSYGIIYYNGSDTATGRNAIPTGWVKATF